MKSIVYTIIVIIMGLMASLTQGQNPNDPLFNQQTYLETINVPEAWSVETGSSSLTIGVIIPSGVFAGHEDLSPRVTLQHTGPAQDTLGTGTVIAGIAGAATNNNLGIAGINWASPVYSYDAGTLEQREIETPSGTITEFFSVLDEDLISDLIDDAVSDGVDVMITPFQVVPDDHSPSIEIDKFQVYPVVVLPDREEILMTVGGFLMDIYERISTDDNYVDLGQSLKHAYKDGATIVSPMPDYDGVLRGMPTNLNDQHISIAVGGTDLDGDNPLTYSASGSESSTESSPEIEVVAPGEDVLTTAHTGTSDYEYVHTTSASAGIVGGVASLLESKDASLYPDDVRQILRRTAIPMNGQEYDNTTGFGLIDAEEALQFLDEHEIDHATINNPTNTTTTKISSGETINVIGSVWKEITSKWYNVDMYKVEGTVNLPLNGDAWFRANGSKGWSPANPNRQIPHANISVNEENYTADFTTYVYYDNNNNSWFPTHKDNVEIQYTVSTPEGSVKHDQLFPTNSNISTGTYTGTTSMDPDVTLTINSDDTVLMRDHILMPEVHSVYPEIQLEGKLIIHKNHIEGGKILVQDGGHATIAEDVTFEGTRIEVEEGGTLEVINGTEFLFDADQGLISHGTLEFNGDPNDPINFSAKGSNNWDGIEMHGSDSNLSNIKIEDSEYGIELFGSDLKLLSVEIEQAENGISAYNASNITLYNVSVTNTNNNQDGIRLINTTLSSLSGQLNAEDNSRYGLYVDGQSNSGLNNNTLKNNSSGQLVIDGGGSFTNISNTLATNTGAGTNGLMAMDNSHIQISSSSIYDNPVNDAYAIQNSTIDAQSNWWGQAPPSGDQFYEDATSDIDYSNHLFWDPLPSGQSQEIAAANPDSSAQQAEASSTGQRSSVPWSEVQSVSELRMALAGQSNEELLSTLDRHISDLPSELQPWADVLRIEAWQQRGNHSQAVEYGEVLFNQSGRPEALRRTTGRRLFYSYLQLSGKQAQAEEVIASLKALEDPEAEDGQLTALLERYSDGQASGEEEGELADAESAEPEKLTVENYPNPFNPVTTITFDLPEDAHVELAVYDVTGRRVATVVDGRHTSGTHQAGWDGSDAASGTYLYRLQITETEASGSGQQVKTGTMTLVK